jgi:uncharacterized protein YbjT (DUF2867 family)
MVEEMKIAVIGGTGLIGSRVVTILTKSGHEAVPHSPSTGLDLLSGHGLPEALAGAEVVVNLTNSPTSSRLRNHATANSACFPQLNARHPTPGVRPKTQPVGAC